MKMQSGTQNLDFSLVTVSSMSGGNLIYFSYELIQNYERRCLNQSDLFSVLSVLGILGRDLKNYFGHLIYCTCYYNTKVFLIGLCSDVANPTLTFSFKPDCTFSSVNSKNPDIFERLP